jgi:hypothetical protein
MFSRKMIPGTPQLAYSLDFALSDFFPFSCIKRKFTEYAIPDPQSLKSAITHIFDEIGQETFRAAFDMD